MFNYLIDIKDIDIDFLVEIIASIVSFPPFMERSDFYHQNINSSARETIFIDHTVGVVNEFYKNTDHGFAHSVNVYNRAKKIAEDIAMHDQMFNDIKDETIHILKWSAIFHDISRFYGKNKNRGFISKALVEDVFFYKNDPAKTAIFLCIERHDWFNTRIDGELPDKFKRNPIVDIFRLADKTSISPLDELKRYYKTGKKYNTIFFNPNIPISRRFEFKDNLKERDMITFFLLIFIMNENSFFFNATRRIYMEWAINKEDLKKYIVKDLCVAENIPLNQIRMINEILNMV